MVSAASDCGSRGAQSRRVRHFIGLWQVLTTLKGAQDAVPKLQKFAWCCSCATACFYKVSVANVPGLRRHGHVRR
jgi:hypothetical protein